MFYITELLQKNTATNEERRLPRLAFSAVLVVQTMSPSGVGAIQELIGDSKELEKTTRMYYAFVWSMTFRIPTLFSAYGFLNQLYGIKGRANKKRELSNVHAQIRTECLNLISLQ